MKNEDYNCIFSIVMAIYNCEPFLREALDSILDQERFSRLENSRTVGTPLSLEEICEVIMVDDGSTDSSGKICDEYAEKYSNFKVIHKENGGVASARNAGLAHVKGKYMNFLDGDDRFSGNVLREVYSFFEKNYEICDVVTVPLRFFDAIDGEHWQNYKFGEHSEVVYLFERYDSPLMFVNASFFKSEHRDSYCFCDRLVCGEDIRYICEILADKMTMGLVPTCRYFYRRRSTGEESLVQTSKRKRGWYFDYLEHLTEWGIDFCNKKWGYVPFYYQNILLCDLQWRFNSDYEATARAILGDAGYEEYKQRLFGVIRHFDDKIILAQRSLWSEHKHLILCKKYGALPKRIQYPDDVKLTFGDTHFGWLSSCFTELEFIKIEDSVLILEGKTVIYGYPEGTDYELFFEMKDNDWESLLRCEITERDASTYRLEHQLYRGICFKARIPLEKITSARLSLVLFANGEKIVKKRVRYGKFAPIGQEFKSSFYSYDGYIVTAEDYFLNVKRTSVAEIKRKRKDYLGELWNARNDEMRKAAVALITAALLRKFKKKPLIIISDRVNRAGDNGEAFFRFLCTEKIRDFRFVFAIERTSTDYKKLRAIGPTVNVGGKFYKLLHLVADCIVSSHADEHTTNPFGNRYPAYKSIICEKKYVFLQHGITKDDASAWLGRFNKNIDGLVCAAKAEADSFEDKSYGYLPKNIWRTGFPRFDRLYEDTRRYITVMPTWRMYLSAWDNAHPGVWKIGQRFKNSEYFKFYNKLLNDEEIIQKLKEYGYTLCFMPHPNAGGAIELFTRHRDVIFFSCEKEYRDIFAESSLILTDYSSVVFDFAYMRKPIIYTQFDRDEFFAGGHAYKRGYFDYESDGFGEVARDYASTKNLIVDYASKECRLKPKYRERMDDFFLYSDKNNSLRVYKKLLKLLNQTHY